MEKKEYNIEYVEKLEAENKAMKAYIIELQNESEKMKLELEELKKIVFWSSINKPNKDKSESDNKNNKNDSNSEDNSKTSDENKENNKKRTKESYKKAIPKEEDITDRVTHKINKCPSCNRRFTKKKIVIYYEEDILVWEKDKPLKKVTEHKVESWYCSKCKKWYSSVEKPSKKVSIWPNVQIYILYLLVIMRLSLSSIRHLLKDVYNFEISDWMIVKIQNKYGWLLEPEFNKIKERLRTSKWVHIDETSWGRKYLWVAKGVDSSDVLYLFMRTRGKKNALEILWPSFNGVRIADGYGAYKHLPWVLQLCWAHPHRKLRDLANSSTLVWAKRILCRDAYSLFSDIYMRLRMYLKERFDADKRSKQKKALMKELIDMSQPNENDPKKLEDIKKSFIRNMHNWFTCMDFDGIPCDNNAAERSIRHFVIKRKTSFWSKSETSANSLSIISSVLMTLRNENKENFVEKLNQFFYKNDFIWKLNFTYF